MNKTILTKVMNYDTFEESVRHVKKIVSESKFGVLYTIDFGAMSVEKRGVMMDNYIQLGICHPDIWFGLLDKDKSFGALLPCPLCIYEDNGEVIVSIVDSEAQLSIHPSYSKSTLTQKASCLISDLFGKL